MERKPTKKIAEQAAAAAMTGLTHILRWCLADGGLLQNLRNYALFKVLHLSAMQHTPTTFWNVIYIPISP